MITGRGEGSLVPPRVPALWSPDVPPWPAADVTPAADLAAHRARHHAVRPARTTSEPAAVAVLERPVPAVEEPTRAPARAVDPAAPRPSSELDAFLAEAEKSVRAKRKNGPVTRGERR